MRKIVFILVVMFIVHQVHSQGTWTQKANFGGAKRCGAIGFSIGNKGYLGTGVGAIYNMLNDFWEWDQSTDVWTQKANFPDTTVCWATGFSIANKGYICTGFNWATGQMYNDLWEYDSALNTWKQKASFPGTRRNGAVVFTIGFKGYMGTGQDDNANMTNDFWEYDAVSDTWNQKANFPLQGRAWAVGFSIGNKGYACSGAKTSICTGYKDFWEFDPATNVWSPKATLPTRIRDNATGFSIGNFGYIGMGDSVCGNQNNSINLFDLWQYNPYTNSWMQMANYGGGKVAAAASFVIGCKGYVGTGYLYDNLTTIRNDFWEFTPPTPSAVVAGINTICAGDSTSLFAAGGLFYQWSTGETTNIIHVKPTNTSAYSVIVSDACGADTANITVTVIPYPVVAVQYKPDLCGTGVVQFTDSSTNAIAWNWDFGDGHTDTAQNPANIYPSAGQYIVTVTVSPSPFGCTTKSQFTVDIPSFSELFIPTAFSPNGDDNNDVYYVFGSCITNMNFKIYNRWGEIIFETSDQKIGWDGTFKGEKQNAGVYMFSFVGKLTTGEEINKKGNITLMK